MSKNPPLVVTDIRKNFDKIQAVRGVSFTVKPGEVLGIVGPNGAGKTTTIKIILGLLEPDKGEVMLFGDQSTDSTVRRRIGYMPETPSFYKHLTGRELLLFAASLFEIPRATAAEKAHELLKKVGLQKAGDRALQGYSKGMLQRICLAQALINDPELLFLDEPLDGLDPLGRVQMREILQTVKENGTAIVFNSHILADVAAVSTHIAIMDKGQLIASGPVEKVVPRGKTLEDVFMHTVTGNKEEA
jgi:ABC-2 type transport system ATP-binding protein